MQLPTIYVIRHGQSQTNVDQISCGWAETELTPTGLQQANLAGEFLRTIDFKHAFVSSLGRTRQTYAALELPENLPVAYEKGLWELDFGDYDLKPFTKFADEVSMPKILGDWSLRIPAGESVNDVKARLAKFFKEKLEGKEGPVLLVSHGMTTRIILALLSSGNSEQMIEEKVTNCEVWKIENGDCQKVFVPAEAK